MKELCTSSLEFKNKWQNTLLLLLEMIVVVAFMISQTSLWLKETFTVIYQCKKWILFSNKKFTLRFLWKSYSSRSLFETSLSYIFGWFKGLSSRMFFKQGQLFCSHPMGPFTRLLVLRVICSALCVYYYYLAQIRAYIHIKRCYPLI